MTSTNISSVIQTSEWHMHAQLTSPISKREMCKPWDHYNTELLKLCLLSLDLPIRLEICLLMKG